MLSGSRNKFVYDCICCFYLNWCFIIMFPEIWFLYKHKSVNCISFKSCQYRGNFTCCNCQRTEISLFLKHPYQFWAHLASCSVSSQDIFPLMQGPGHEAHYWPPSNTEVKNAWSCATTLLYAFMACIGTTSLYLHAFQERFTKCCNRLCSYLYSDIL